MCDAPPGPRSRAPSARWCGQRKETWANGTEARCVSRRLENVCARSGREEKPLPSRPLAARMHSSESGSLSRVGASPVGVGFGRSPDTVERAACRLMAQPACRKRASSDRTLSILAQRSSRGRQMWMADCHSTFAVRNWPRAADCGGTRAAICTYVGIFEGRRCRWEISVSACSVTVWTERRRFRKSRHAGDLLLAG